MKKKIIILLILISTVIFASCSKEETVWLTVETPYFLTTGFAIGRGLNLDADVLDFEIIDSLNESAFEVEISDKNQLMLNFFTTKDTKLIDENIIGFAGQPLILHRGTVRIKIYKNDIDKLKRSIVKVAEFENNKLSYNIIDFIIQDIYTGQIDHQVMPMFESDIETFLKALNKSFEEGSEEMKSAYKMEGSFGEIAEFTAKITSDCKNDSEKALIIAQTIYKVIKPFSSEEIKKVDDFYINGGAETGTYNYNYYLTSVDYVFKEKKGNCNNTAYLVKTMLDSLEIKNKLVVGTIQNSIYEDMNGEGHMFNAIWDEESEKWLWLDGTTGGFDDPRMYDCIKRNGTLNLEDV